MCMGCLIGCDWKFFMKLLVCMFRFVYVGMNLLIGLFSVILYFFISIMNVIDVMGLVIE